MFCCDLSPPPRIDESSPLWTMSPDSLKEEKFEIILTLEGIVPETGNNIQVHKCGFYYLLRKQIMFQVRTSYLPTEILWGYKFEHSCVEYNPKLATYEVSFESLNTMIRDNTPWYNLRNNFCIILILYPSTSPKSYFDKQRRFEEVKEDSLCDTPTGGSPSLQKTIFAKPRHKNRILKLTDSPKN